MPNVDRRKLTVRLSPTAAVRLRVEAASRELSCSALVAQLLESYVQSLDRATVSTIGQ